MKKVHIIAIVVIIAIAFALILARYYTMQRGYETVTPTTPPQQTTTTETTPVPTEAGTTTPITEATVTQPPQTPTTPSPQTPTTPTALPTPSPTPTAPSATVTETTSPQTPTTTITTETTTTPAPQPQVVFLKLPEGEEPKFGLVEIAFNISGLSYSNPFDTSDIDVWVHIETPSGSRVAVPAFYFQNYTVKRLGPGEEIIVRVGRPYWLARFAPVEEGVHKFYVKAVDGRGSAVVSEIREFMVKGVAGRGFVRVDSGKRLFVFDSGESMFMLGIDVAWPPDRRSSISFYEQWFDKLNKSGIKVVRIGLVPWALTLEWSKLHYYSLDDAARIDEIVKLAEKYDIYIVFVFMWHGELADNWGDNPYNAARGGPLQSPEEFWSNAVAISIFKDKVRYIIARWGYSTHILAWELINEADLTTNFFSARSAFVSWVKEISSYIKSVDPYNRIVTVNLADYNSEPRVWSVESIDIINVHRYGPEGFKDIALAIPSIVEGLWNTYRKPIIITEFGVDYRWIGYPGFKGTPYWAYDKSGVGLHEGLWSSIFSLSPVSAMSWWWDTQIDSYNLWYHYKALYEFLKSVDPVRGGLGKARASLVITDVTPSSITLYPLAGWVWVSPVRENRLVIRPDGAIEGRVDLLSGFIYGTCHSQRTLNPVFTVMFIDRGRVVLHINSVGRGSAKLVIYVNGSLATQLDLPDKDGKSDGSANEYDMDVELWFEPGTYEIKIDSEACDWFTWDYIVFENAVYRAAKVDLYALANSTFAMLWVRNKDYNWWNVVVLNKTLEPAEGVEVEIRGLQDGVYRVEFWDTCRGVVVKSMEVQVSNGVARVPVGSVEKDIAIKITRAG